MPKMSRPEYTVGVRRHLPKNLREKVSAALAQAVKQRQAQRQATQHSDVAQAEDLPK